MPKFTGHDGVRKAVVWLLFIIYLLVLIKTILLKFPMPVLINILRYGKNRPYSRANLTLFSTIRFYFAHKVSMMSAIRNLLGNVIAFFPLGFFLARLFRSCNLWRTVACALLVSLSFELIQFFTGLGSFDVDDLLLNVVGAAIGYGFCKITTT